MPIYHQLGEVPRKRHVAFRKEDGGIHYEELVGNKGFTGPSSLLYHLRLPT
ncbi:MAG: homogentisate 1,2-dioxygenase, partial [Acidobacteria bacterium]|nr:homogentisate 1,2-dioxygenase [Acidobacteriota bacterium]